LPSAQENESWAAMFRITAFVLAAMALSIARTPAQDPSPELIELKELRVILEQHSRRLEAIQEQLNELRASVGKEAKEKLALGACRTYVCVLKSTLQNARYRVFIQI
jgi:hypothetical protein